MHSLKLTALATALLTLSAFPALADEAVPPSDLAPSVIQDAPNALPLTDAELARVRGSAPFPVEITFGFAFAPGAPDGKSLPDEVTNAIQNTNHVNFSPTGIQISDPRLP
jgi:hypothetical protein